MELVVVILILAVGAFAFVKLYKKPTAESVFEKHLLPPGYEFYYYNGLAGYAINAHCGEFILRVKAKNRPYRVDSIRSIERKWISPDRVVSSAYAGLKGVIDASLANAALQGEANEQSGLFIYLSDIECPRVQIRFDSEDDLLKAYEIFSQLMEGKLKPQASN